MSRRDDLLSSANIYWAREMEELGFNKQMKEASGLGLYQTDLSTSGWKRNRFEALVQYLCGEGFYAHSSYSSEEDGNDAPKESTVHVYWGTSREMW